ncbi:MAG: DinB family protein [Phycisphaerales bacterium]|nr:DinB family protein [Phycisphaerales bacterium]
MAKWPWVERGFSFDYPVGKYPDIVERFRGLPARVEDRVRGLTREQLTFSDGGWSIQQNVGHLLQLEPLFDGRLDDFLAGVTPLRAADMSNRATNEANYNEWDIERLCLDLRTERLAQVERLNALSQSDFARESAHPRLNIKMRLVDAVAFVCEHDDYHMARIAELTRKTRS